jgi:hypothetical protein
MSYNGSGTFNINTAGQPVVTGTVITSTAFNLLTADLASGLTTALTKDGQTTPTANIPMGTFKITGLGAGTALTDAAQFGQLQAGATQIAVVTGTDTLAGTLTPTPTAYATGNLFSFVAVNTNTGAATINLNSLGAKSITKLGSTALAAGDIVSGRIYLIEYDGTRFQLINPSASSVASFSAGTTGFTPSTATTGAVTLAGTLITSNGGTGLSSYTSGDLPYYATGTALSKLGIGTNGQILTSSGTAPQWSTLSGVAVTTFSAGTTGFTPSSATSGAVTLAGTLATTNGGTGLTSFTSGGVVYASSTSALATGSALNFDGSKLLVSSSGEQVKLLSSGDFTTTGTGYIRWYDSGGAKGYIGYAGTANQFDLQTGAGMNLNFNAVGGTTTFAVSNAEQMRLTTTGLGIGTSSPSAKLDLVGIMQWQATAGTVLGKLTYSGGEPVILANTGLGLRFFTNNTQAAVIDSSGNLGLGVTPSAWSTSGSYAALQIGAVGLYGRAAASNELYLTSNAFNSATGFKYIYTASATRYDQDTGKHIWYNAPSGTAGNAITFTQAMTLDASGNLGVGVTSPSAKLHVAGATSNAAISNAMALTQGGAGAGTGSSLYIGYGTTIGQYGSISGFYDGTGTALTFGTSPVASSSAVVERARIDSSGNLLVGKTATNVLTRGAELLPTGQITSTLAGSTSGTDTLDVYSTGAGAYRFYVDMAGTIHATAIVITAISDQRLKENVRDIETGLSSIMALKPRRFDWKEGKGQDKKNAAGFIAQEFEEVFPECVSTSKAGADGIEYKNINHETLIPTLVKAIQELKAEFDAYKSTHP